MSERCFECGGEARLVFGEQVVRFGSRSTTVTGEFMECSSCGERFFLPDQMDAIQRAAAAKIREEEGLLPPDEIKALREELGLSQSEFERLIGAGPKTVVRWEKGTVFQSRTADTLLRVLRRHPEVARELAKG